jgi:hypothetical protein
MKSRAVQLDLQFDAPELRDASPLIVRHPRARRYVLRLLPDGTPRVTIPRWGSRREALRFAESQEAWIARERARLADRVAQRPPARWPDGHAVLLRGETYQLRRVPDTPGDRATGHEAVKPAGRSLLVRTTAHDLKPVVTSWLRNLARAELPALLACMAAAHGLSFRRVSIRSQRTRWGSCAPNGTISLNWRLVQMPPPVRDYVLLHELMHLRQQNHSRRFWRLVASVYPAFREAERWLKSSGRSLF